VEVISRRRREIKDPFQQQVEDVSFLVQKPKKKYPLKTLPSGSESDNMPTFEGDTRVNELMSETLRRGGLIMLEPDAEFLNRDRDSEPLH